MDNLQAPINELAINQGLLFTKGVAGQSGSFAIINLLLPKMLFSIGLILNPRKMDKYVSVCD
ncbi:MAG: hypothetical protein ACTHWH_18505 [Marinobacter sp.]|uniref:hypothetical protein n=1 Tax=Marinobacter sp. TaxID=50741 RepID=UPI003F9CFD3B